MYCRRIHLPLVATMAEQGVDLLVMLAICSENGRWPAVISNSAICPSTIDSFLIYLSPVFFCLLLAEIYT